MKLLLKLLIVVLVFYLCYSLLAQVPSTPQTGPAPNNDGRVQGTTGNAEDKPPDLTNPNTAEMEDEDFFSYDQDFLTRKLFQKKLAPLTWKERIVWSFRLADSNAFL